MDELLNQPTIRVDQAADLIGVSRAAAYAAAKSGELPVLRIGRRMVVPTAALRKMLGIDTGAAA